MTTAISPVSDHPAPASRRVAAALLTLLPLVGLSGCTGDPAASADAPGSPGPAGEQVAAPSADATEAAGAGSTTGATTVPLADDLALLVTPPDDSTWEVGQGSVAAVQWRPRADAAQDQPWDDVLLYAAAGVVDPATGEDVPLPEDPAAWLVAHPDLEVVAERDVEAAGVQAVQMDATVVADTELMRTDDGPVESVAGAFERLTLLEVDGTLVVLQASSFSAVDGVLPPTDADVYDDLLASLRPAD
jgi:hypothetical protein